MLVDKQLFINWQQNPVTKILMQWIRNDREECLVNLSSDALMFNPNFPQLAAKWAEMITFYDSWLNMSYKEVDDAQKQEESDG